MGIILYYICICLYIYGDLAIFIVIIIRSLGTVTWWVWCVYHVWVVSAGICKCGLMYILLHSPFLSLLFFHFLSLILTSYISSSKRTSFTTNESNSSNLYADFYDTFESSAFVNSTVDLYIDYEFNSSVNSTVKHHHRCFGSSHVNETQTYYIYLVSSWWVQT